MDLIGKVAIIGVFLIVAFSVLYLATRHNGSGITTPQQAEAFVLNDLKASHPGANITIVGISNSTVEKYSYNVVLSIVYNATKPCPTLFIESYDYPAAGLAPSTDNMYTSKCVIYGLSDAPSYVISSPYIAIAQSYNKNITSIRDYVDAYGYNNTKVHARFYANLSANDTPLGRGFYNVWLVNYTANGANYAEYEVLNASGSFAGNYTASIT